MKTSGFLYVMGDGVASYGIESGSSTFQLIVPAIPVNPNSSEVLTVWTADNPGNGLALLSRLEIESIEQLTSGVLSGHFVLSGSSYGSVHFRHAGSPPEGYSLPGEGWDIPPPKTDDLVPLTEEQTAYLRALEKKSWKVSFSLPDERKIAEALKMARSIRQSSKLAPRYAVSAIASLFFLTDLARHRYDPEDLSPVGSYALAVLMANGTGRDEAIEKVRSVFLNTRAEASGPREIDSVLKPIDDMDLMPRKYIWPRVDVAVFSWDEALIKTERAEKRHQEILEDCCKYVKCSGLQPKFNRNIDLAISGENGLVFVEIKSANISNFREQALKGALQVIEYALHFENSGINVGRRCVLIEVPKIFWGIDYYKDLLSAIGVEMVSYDDRLMWPARAKGLLGTK